MSAHRIVAHALAAAIFVFAFAAGVRGIDFGWHWDEDRLLLSVSDSFRSGTLLPGRYNYPSVGYALAMAATAPEAAGALADAVRVVRSDVPREVKQALLAGISSRVAPTVDLPAFKWRARMLFLAVSLLALAWVYLAVLAWRRDPREALLAAALLGTSWEVGYHARWMAPDTVLMQFAALALATSFAARSAGAAAGRWTVAAAVAAGLAMGTKYQAAVLLVPVLVAAHAHGRASGWSANRIAWRSAIPLVALAAFVALLTTPGALLQPVRFAYDVAFELRHYRTGHGSETVAPGLDHLGRALQYLSFAAFSRWSPLALAVFAAVLAGAADVMRRDRAAATLLLAVPVVALGSMCTMRVMIVRNLLFLLPFLAILAARGVAATAAAMKPRPLAALPWLVAAAIVLVDAGWLWGAGTSIAHRAAIDHRTRVARYLTRHPRETFACSRGVWNLLTEGDRARPNVTRDPAAATRVLLLSTDLRRPWGNRFGVFEPVSGSYEVNFDWYPDWQGEPHVLAVSGRDAARMDWRRPGE